MCVQSECSRQKKAHSHNAPCQTEHTSNRRIWMATSERTAHSRHTIITLPRSFEMRFVNSFFFDCCIVLIISRGDWHAWRLELWLFVCVALLRDMRCGLQAHSIRVWCAIAVVGYVNTHTRRQQPAKQWERRRWQRQHLPLQIHTTRFLSLALISTLSTNWHRTVRVKCSAHADTHGITQPHHAACTHFSAS